MAYGFGNDYGFDPATVRRSLAAVQAPKASWDVPDSYGRAPVTPQPPTPTPQPAPAPVSAAAPSYGSGGVGGATYASTGDPLMDYIRTTAMNDALARSRGARSAAMHASPNDPSLAAYAGLEGLLAGQGDAASALNHGALQRLLQMDQRQFEEYMAKLEHEWRMQEQSRAASAGLWGTAGQVGGALIGAAL